MNKKYLIWVLLVLIILVFLILKTNNKEDDYVSDYTEETLGSVEIIETGVLSDDVIENLEMISPKVGFETGLNNLPILKWIEKSFERSGDNIDIAVKYPQFLGENTTVINSFIEERVNNVVLGNEEESKDSSHITLDIDYLVTGIKEGVVGIELIIEEYPRGGNGNHQRLEIINWDLKSNKTLEMNELFCSEDFLDTLIPLGENQIRIDAIHNERMKDDLEESTVKDIRDKENWKYILVGTDELIIGFKPYSIVGGSFGIIHTVIPYELIQNEFCIN